MEKTRFHISMKNLKKIDKKTLFPITYLQWTTFFNRLQILLLHTEIFSLLKGF